MPHSVSESYHDAAIAAVACLAALLPVHTLQVMLLYLTGLDDEPLRHPLMEMITSAPEPSIAVLIVATLAAVVVAPVCEEITFRLLLQGWLEKWEDHVLRTRSELPDDRTIHYWAGSLENSTEPLLLTGPRPRGLAGLPYGWLPILTSSFLFGLAHFGYGPEPVPLFVLAIFLGYLYQRTHRILPCIVAHALFNLFTMILLWRMVLHASE
jgi:membrane protease YdiL (CAAX protease family)